MTLKLAVKKRTALDHVENVRGQLRELTHLLECNANCMDVMRQIQTVQSSLDDASRATLRRHRDACYSTAMLDGSERRVIDELIDAVNSAPALSGSPTPSHAPAIGPRPASKNRRHLSATRLTLPGISSRTCKAAIERVVSPIVGVGAAEVDVLTKSITIYHDYRAPARQLIEAIEEQGYHVADASVTNSPSTATKRDSLWQKGCLGDGTGASTAETSPTGELVDLYTVHVGHRFIDGDGI
jgi:DNA-binding FrmR family transcriptional regulator/copper chaperone CopZ